MKTMAELQAIRDRKKQEINNRNNSESDIKVFVGMATCGIAAGARTVLNAMVSEVNKRGLSNVKVSPTGCIGNCKYEPIVEVVFPNKDKVTYVGMTADKALRVVAEHIVNGNPINEFMLAEEGDNK